MVLDDAELEISRNKLSDLRAQIEVILHQDWQRFGDVNKVITAYVLLLNTIPLRCFGNMSGLAAELDILKNLKAKLEQESKKARDNFYRLQFSFAYAHMKRDEMIKQLESVTEIPNELKQWIRSQIQTEDDIAEEDWDETLKFPYFLEGHLKKRAQEEGEDVEHLIQTMNPDKIDADNPELLKDRFTAYQNKIADAEREMEDNLSIYSLAPRMCKSVEALVLFLTASGSFFLRDDMKVDEESQNVHCPVQSDDGARVDEETQDVRCSMQSDDGDMVLSSEAKQDDGPDFKRKRP